MRQLVTDSFNVTVTCGEIRPAPEKNFLISHVRAFLCAACFLIVSSSVFAAVPQSERDVLIALYNSMNGNQWPNNTNWCTGPCPTIGVPTFNVTGTECTWTGVTCNDTGTHVIDLYLPCGTGSISSLSGLIALESFSAPGCFGIARNYQLTGSIPDLTALTALQSFFVAGNQLTGPIPSLTGLTALQYFDVSSNNLSGGIPALTGLDALQQFYVEGNQLSGLLPDLSGLTNFGIDASYNHLTGPIPGLPSTLQGFSASHNGLTGSIPALNGLSKLGGFDVGYNQLTGSIPSLAGLTMSWFDVSHNQLTGSLQSFAGFQVNNFFIQGNHLSGPLPAPPSGLTYCNLRDPICQAEICPNSFALVDDQTWDNVIGVTPWWATPYPSNQCDELFIGSFD